MVVAWLVVAIPVAIWLAEGGWTAMSASVAGAVTGLGILAGLVGTASMVLMLWLAARVPFIDRTIGHDRALGLHADLGQATILALLLHAVFLVTGYALADGSSWLGEWASLWGTSDLALAIVAMVGLGAVAVTSVATARRRLPHEAWHGVHLLTYAAVLLALPHQFTSGELFADGPAFWFWSGLWGLTFLVFLTHRVFLPVFVTLEHRPVVSRVRWETRDTVSIEVTGRHLGKLGIQAGQFLHWRFLAPGLWWHQHPFSVSAAPHGDTVRLTMRILGSGTERIAHRLRPGTRVAIEGPYGRFTEESRTSPGVVLVGIGIGVAPLRALLETTTVVPGHATVVLRARTADDIAHLGEFEAWCDHRGAQLVVLTGRRGFRRDRTTSWLPQSHADVGLRGLVDDLAHCDVYVCGPEGAAEQVLAEARASGTPADHLHHERFSW